MPRGRERRAPHPISAWRLIAALVLLAAAAGALVSPASAAAFNYSATATGIGARVVFSASGAPLAESPLDIGGPLAQVRLDSVGRSEALAAFPYPGELVLTAPGVIAGSAPEAPPVPPYPFAAHAQQPLMPEDEAGDERNRVAARAEPAAATASSVTDAGGDAAAIGSLSALASVVTNDETVTATSESTAKAVVVGPLRISTVRATAQVVLGPSGLITRQSTLTTEGASIGGVGVTLTADGVVAQDTLIGVDQAAVTAMLQDAGVELRLLAEEQTQDGVISAGLEIVHSQHFASLGDGSIRLLLGQAIVSGTVGGGVPPVEPNAVPAPAPPPPSITAEPTLPVEAPRPTPRPTPSARPALTATTTEEVATLTRLGSQLNLFDLRRVYPVLFLGAAALLVMSPIGGLQMRTENARQRWTR